MQVSAASCARTMQCVPAIAKCDPRVDESFQIFVRMKKAKTLLLIAKLQRLIAAKLETQGRLPSLQKSSAHFSTGSMVSIELHNMVAWCIYVFSQSAVPTPTQWLKCITCCYNQCVCSEKLEWLCKCQFTAFVTALLHDKLHL